MVEEDVAWFSKGAEFPDVLSRDEPENILIPQLFPVSPSHSLLEKQTPVFVHHGWPHQVNSLPCRPFHFGPPVWLGQMS